jgi:hypothetical protein
VNSLGTIPFMNDGKTADDGIGGNLPVSRRALRWPAACRPAVIRQMI